MDSKEKNNGIFIIVIIITIIITIITLSRYANIIKFKDMNDLIQIKSKSNTYKRCPLFKL